MTSLMPAGQAERAAQLFAELRAWKEDSEKRGIPEIIAEIHRDRLWLALHYDTWESACDALLGGLRVQLPRDDRREITAELHHEQGMSTRAIGTALGVSHTTVKRDLAGGTNVPPEPTPVTGLDGKTYTRKPVTHIHIDPDDDVPDDEAESLAEQFETRTSVTARYPELNIADARDTDIIKVGHALDGVPAEQRAARLANGVKWLHAQVRNGPSQPLSDPAASGDQIAAAINRAISDITKAGGTSGFAESWDHVDGFTRTNWAAAVADMAARVTELQQITHIDGIRRIK